MNWSIGNQFELLHDMEDVTSHVRSYIAVEVSVQPVTEE